MAGTHTGKRWRLLAPYDVGRVAGTRNLSAGVLCVAHVVHPHVDTVVGNNVARQLELACHARSLRSATANGACRCSEQKQVNKGSEGLWSALAVPACNTNAGGREAGTSAFTHVRTRCVARSLTHSRGLLLHVHNGSDRDFGVRDGLRSAVLGIDRHSTVKTR